MPAAAAAARAPTRSISGPATGAATTARPVTSPDDETGDPEAEAAALVEVDDLERQDGAPAEVVQEDPGLDDPEVGREPEGEPLQAAHLL